ncbi:MAG: M15 family metallopeptidase [Bacteroidales bacterium]|nr:M15 family metallopeptidase [Bacteroidales bacterium]
MRYISFMVALILFWLLQAQGNLFNADSIMRNFLLGKYEPSKHPDFTLIDSLYTYKKNIYMQREAYEAFIRMCDSAKKEGIHLFIVSATRTFNDQKNIWEKKWYGKNLVEGKNLTQTHPDPVERARFILRYSSMPGTSRHHWGTDIDINSVDPAYFKTTEGNQVYTWLQIHAASFGFCQPYIEFGELRSTGYQPEPWHWSYMPLSSKYLQAYEKLITYDDIKGFAGSETARILNIFDNFVKGINNNCLLWNH